MPEKKLVIKINYDTERPDRKAVRHTPPKEIVEWKLKRIVGVLMALVFLAGFLMYGGSNEEDTARSIANLNVNPLKNKAKNAIQPKQDEPETFPAIVTAPAEEASLANDNSSANLAGAKKSLPELLERVEPAAPVGRVRRWQFSSEIKRREPVDKLSPPFFARSTNPGNVYFFTEMRGFTGHTVKHIWKRNGSVFLTKPFKVGGNRWRIYTGKLLDMKSLGSWEISVVDSSGNTLVQETFEVKNPEG